MLFILFILWGLMLLTTSGVYAEGVTAEKIVTSTNGSVDYVIKGLCLEDGASYQWAIEKSKDATITNWYTVTAPEYQTGTVRITVTVEEKSLLEILKSTDIAYITIRKVGTNNDILKAQQVDLTLPLLKAYTVVQDEHWRRGYTVEGVYGMPYKNIQYNFEKITDANVINNYIDKDHDLSKLLLKTINSIPSVSNTNWKSIERDYSDSEYIPKEEIPTEEGLYYIWFKGSGVDIKTIYGQAVVEVGEVKKITTSNSENNGNSGTTQKPEDSSNKNQSNTSTSTDKTQENTNNNSSQTQKPATNNLMTQKTNSISKGSQTNNINTTSPKVDSTTATNILPKTGTGIAMLGVMLFVVALGIGRLVKIHSYKDVK